MDSGTSWATTHELDTTKQLTHKAILVVESLVPIIQAENEYVLGKVLCPLLLFFLSLLLYLTC